MLFPNVFTSLECLAGVWPTMYSNQELLKSMVIQSTSIKFISEIMSPPIAVWQRVYNVDERQKIDPFKEEYMKSTSATERKMIAQSKVFPALFTYWSSIGVNLNSVEQDKWTEASSIYCIKVQLLRCLSTLPSPIDSRWNPHIPHGLMESRWSPHGIKQFFSNVVASYGLQMDSRWTPWNPGGVQVESRWNPTQF